MNEPLGQDASVDSGVCGLLIRDGEVLLDHRSSSKAWAPNSWDAPSGHLERGESDIEALARELQEKLAVTIVQSEVRLIAHLTGANFDVRVFVVGQWSGEPTNAEPIEHDDVS